MPVSLTKVVKKSPTVPKLLEPIAHTEPSELPLEDLADRYGTLKDRVQAIMQDPVFGQFQLVEEELKARLKTYEPDEIVKITGKQWFIEAGACSKKPRAIADIQKAMKMLGAAFFQIAKLPVGETEKYLTPEQMTQILAPEVEGENFTDTRKIKSLYLGGKK